MYIVWLAMNNRATWIEEQRYLLRFRLYRVMTLRRIRCSLTDIPDLSPEFCCTPYVKVNQDSLLQVENQVTIGGRGDSGDLKTRIKRM